MDLNDGGESMRVMYPLFQAGEGGSTPTSPLQFWLVRITFAYAKSLNRLWHSILPKLGTGSITNPEGRFTCFGAEFEGRLFSVAIWSKPVSRELPNDGTWLELRRLAISPDAPRNTASRMLAIMTRLLRTPMVHRLISYQDMEYHTGAIYRAAGWKEGQITKGHEWTTPTRQRPNNQKTADRKRWEKIFFEPHMIRCLGCGKGLNPEAAENPHLERGPVVAGFKREEGWFCGECFYDMGLAEP